MRRFRFTLLATLLLLLTTPACSMTPGAEAPAADAQAETKRAVMESYADMVFVNYTDAHQQAVALQEALQAFVAAPSEETMEAARAAWLAAREPYGQSEVYRFYGGPIDDEDGPEGLLNAWPLDEAYIDYVEGNPDAGIINNPDEYPTIDKALLTSLNEAGAEENISTGYHAIEFLLWGQDQRSDGAGQRPHTDYIVDGSAANPERRAQYLTVAAELLVEQLATLRAEWDPEGAGNYRATFLALEPDEAIQKMLTGMGVLSKSELAGERIFTAYDNQDQEDEHSCFSDNTHRDIATNALGIRNVYLGQYTRPDGSVVSGTGLQALVEAVNPDLNQEMLTLLDASMKQVEALHVPFDQAIVLADSRPTVLDTVNALQDQGDKLAEVAQALEITINTALPE